MTEKPIIFSGPMVRAILDGRKTQTRRALKTPGPEWVLDPAREQAAREGYYWFSPDPDEQPGCFCARPRYREGDQLWVREAWRAERRFDKMPMGTKPTGAIVWREADGPPPQDAGFGRLRPSIHMPRWASRITLRVTSIKVERLQDISEADAKAEGPPFVGKVRGQVWQSAMHMRLGIGTYWDNARDWYADLWNLLHGPGAWEANPWVLAYTFERIDA